MHVNSYSFHVHPPTPLISPHVSSISKVQYLPTYYRALQESGLQRKKVKLYVYTSLNRILLSNLKSACTVKLSKCLEKSRVYTQEILSYVSPTFDRNPFFRFRLCVRICYTTSTWSQSISLCEFFLSTD